jgi:hypothetical protein
MMAWKKLPAVVSPPKLPEVQLRYLTAANMPKALLLVEITGPPESPGFPHMSIFKKSTHWPFSENLRLA